ncbi:MAG: hypothetical protein KC933_35505 [Myxococcales bacterium]|nr:hypothetical protein [Myxococcales bacterium]MCB9646160.1 hypothetical protein [Deltaproteobacteria bacterium]
MRRRPTPWLAAGLALWAAGCKDDAPAPPPAAEDASAPVAMPVFEDPSTGARFSWPPTWRRVAAADTPDEDSVTQLARVERVGLASPVAPRVVLSAEPTTLTDPELAHRKVKNLLEAQLDGQGAKVRRISLLKHHVDGQPVGVLDVLYAVPVPDRDPVAVRHRSMVALVHTGEGSLAILTLTATYLAGDHDRVGTEVDAILHSLGLAPPPPAPSPDRGG